MSDSSALRVQDNLILHSGMMKHVEGCGIGYLVLQPAGSATVARFTGSADDDRRR